VGQTHHRKGTQGDSVSIKNNTVQRQPRFGFRNLISVAMAASAFPMIFECRTAHCTEDRATVVDSPVSLGPMIGERRPRRRVVLRHTLGNYTAVAARVLHAEVVFVSSLIMKRSGSTRSRAEPK
jgi:hypothetical protein